VSFNIRDRAKKLADRAVTATKDTTKAAKEMAQSEDTKDAARNIRDRAKKLADKAVTATKDTTSVVQEIAQTEDAKEVGRGFKTIVKDMLKSDIAKHAIAGVVAGVFIAALLPGGFILLGAQIGLAIGIYKGITK